MNRFLNAGILLISVLVTACVSTPAVSPLTVNTTIAPQDPLIAQDFANTLSQIPQLHPSGTTIRIGAQSLGAEPFARSLKLALESVGYAIRVAENSQMSGDVPLSFSVSRQSEPLEQEKPDNSETLMYTIAVGEVYVRRSYLIFPGDSVKPIAAMQIRGADATNIRSNDTIFEQSAPTKPTSTDDLFVQESGITEQPSAPLNTQEDTDDLAANTPLIDIVAPSLSGTQESLTGFGSIAELSNTPTQNFRDLGESNFSALFDNYAIVSETILTFDNDSTRLGQNNKARVQRFVERFVADTDVFSVIGCSNGGTNLAIGQKGLALGRAERVRQELLYAGVPDSNILDEGCWAEEAFDERMPRRGVVLTLKRSG